MTYELDSDLKEIVECFEKEGYNILGAHFTTTVIRDSSDKATNAYTEACGIKLKKGNYIADIEFYLRHERPHMKRRIKRLKITPPIENLNDVISSTKILCEII